MRKLALIVLLLPAALAYGQDPQPPATDKPADAAAGPAVVDSLMSDLALTKPQAEASAGALFGIAKTKLKADDFAKIAGVVPNMDTLLKGAPAFDPKLAALEAVAGKSGSGSGLGAVAGVASSLAKLGIKPETILKLGPSLVKAVSAKGGADIGALLAGALK